MNSEYQEHLIQYEHRILKERLLMAFRRSNTVAYIWAFGLSCTFFIATSIYDYPTEFHNWMITSGIVYLLLMAVDAIAYNFIKNDTTRAIIWNLIRLSTILIQSIYGGYALSLAWSLDFPSMTSAVLGRTLAVLNITNQVIQVLPLVVQNIAAFM